MKRETKIRKAKKIEPCFNAWNNEENGAPVVHDKDHNVVKKRDGEIFLRCTDPYPKEYYISNYGRLISFSNPENPKLRQTKTLFTDGGSRKGYQYTVYKNGRPTFEKNKNGTTSKKKDTATTYAMVLDTWVAHGFYESHVYGSAKDPNVKSHVHHEVKFDYADTPEADAKNNNPETLGKMPPNAHESMIKYAQNHATNRTPQEEQTLIEKLNALAEKETPNSCTILFADIKGAALREYATDDFIKSMPPEGKLLFMLAKKAACINDFLYSDPDFQKLEVPLMYPCILRNSENPNDVLAVMIFKYDRHLFEKNMKKGFIAPMPVKCEKPDIIKTVQNMKETMDTIEIKMYQTGKYNNILNDVITIHYK